MESPRCANCGTILDDIEEVCAACEEELTDPWYDFASEVGGAYQEVEGGLWGQTHSRVAVAAGDWAIILEARERQEGQYSSATYTLIRAPFVSNDWFRFKLTRRPKPSEASDPSVTYPEFEREFMISGTEESKVRALIANARIRELVQRQPSINLQVIHPWWPLPHRKRELRFEERGVIRHVARLETLFELFGETLNHLCAMGSASSDPPDLRRWEEHLMNTARDD
jgi:hypothetical protein